MIQIKKISINKNIKICSKNRKKTILFFDYYSTINVINKINKLIYYKFLKIEKIYVYLKMLEVLYKNELKTCVFVLFKHEISKSYIVIFYYNSVF